MNRTASSRRVGALLVALCALAGCKDEDAATRADDGRIRCAAAQASPAGVGQACDAIADCAASSGLTCPSPRDPSRLGFCSRLCDYASEQDTCGDGATCVYTGAGSWCVPDGCRADVEQPPPTSAMTTVGRVNPEGIGQPCRTMRDCTGTMAKLCEVGSRDGGFDFCTSDCAYSADAGRKQCGEDAACVYFGEGLGRCVPAADAPTLRKPEPEIVDVETRCCLDGPVNEQGLGKRCETHADCAGNKGAAKCPRAFDPRNVGWCTHLCDFGAHDTCGPNGFCWWRRANSSEGMVGSCTPIACKAENNPPVCDGPEATTAPEPGTP